MQTTTSKESARLTLPFVGRRKEAAQLERLYAQRKHALILGPVGVGKTALVTFLKGELDLLVCPHSEHLGSICERFEAQLGLDASGLKLLQRKQRLLRVLADADRTVVFDGVGWTTPKLSSFLECVIDHVPVWIATHSEHSWDVGHVWPLLVRFARVELHAFRPAETRECVAAAVESGLIPREALNVVKWLNYRSDGSPLVLRELLEELAAHPCDLGNPHALRRLDLDRRIHEVFPQRQ